MMHACPLQSVRRRIGAVGWGLLLEVQDELSDATPIQRVCRYGQRVRVAREFLRQATGCVRVDAAAAVGPRPHRCPTTADVKPRARTVGEWQGLPLA